MNAALWSAVLAIVFVQPQFGFSVWSGVGIAFAQDDDGGDDDGGDDDGDDRDDGDRDDGRDNDRSPGKRTIRVKPGKSATPRRTPRVEVAPAPDFAQGEIVVTNLSESDLAQLQTEGFAVIELVELVEVAVVLHRLRVPRGLTLEQARDRVRAQPTGTTGDFNHYYRTEEEPTAPAFGSAITPVALAPSMPCAHLNCAALDLIGWPAERNQSPQCRVTVPVGVIDTGVNAAHENLLGADIEVLRLVDEEVDASKAVHGTAVAALIVGQDTDRVPGLIPEAKVLVVDVFGRNGGDERASVVSLVKALDLLVVRGVKVINMSLAGPPNATLEAALARLAEPGGAVVLAAVGNGGPKAAVAYPAGYPSVLAVTAVDQRGQVYRRAQRGAHIDLAAPGVEVWSATSISGVKPKSGTSFAVPFATAVAAVLASRDPTATPDALAAQLRALVRDIGAPGPDEVFGAGLLSAATLCAPKNFAVPVE
ncbi:S8 family serine peptidase [Cypionkella sp.]|uniref:S8 family serine peptidase n=1 Tax=Cypionkella sp. TaxID=2811411 RepID=UPI002ABBA7E6|nr:S8 family serine peptidase [Cypionkella sp.]MDZ4392882.1 S8 family serine peptidase [Cypionkella sp.]